jgi:hypothetical protein
MITNLGMYEMDHLFMLFVDAFRLTARSFLLSNAQIDLSVADLHRLKNREEHLR